MEAARTVSVARHVRRASWWVYVVTALTVSRVAWLDFGPGEWTVYTGSYTPLTGVDTAPSFWTLPNLAIEGDQAWAAVVTACAAALLMVAAVVQAVVARRRMLPVLATVASTAFAIFLVSAAVNGIGYTTFRTSLIVPIMLAAVAVHELAAAAVTLRRAET